MPPLLVGTGFAARCVSNNFKRNFGNSPMSGTSDDQTVQGSNHQDDDSVDHETGFDKASSRLESEKFSPGQDTQSKRSSVSGNKNSFGPIADATNASSARHKKGDKDGHFHIVGIGASAGGLEALEAVFKALPPDTGMGFVIIQHLSPDFKSHMEELMARHTEMKISRVENGMEVEPNCVYLIPAKMEMVISENRLLLTEKSKVRTLSHPIDQFFRSLANDLGRRSVGVVLSGTGSDGSRGIRDIHEAGGLVIAQDELSAKFDGMPMNAQSTGVVDIILPPQAIAEALVKYVEGGLSPEALAEQDMVIQNFDGIEKIFYLLHQMHGLDFSLYKASTVGRRIQRRADLLSLPSLESYVEYIEGHSEEVNDLYKDLLIGVTKFFRDPEAFKALERQIIPQLFSRTEERTSIRIWVAGCASGEEAYTIAMLIDEELHRRKVSMDVKIFATDAHHGSLQTAAKGIFSEESLSELSSERRNRYFRKKREGYHVTRELRHYVVFAPHNVIRDAPFTQMDLVTCRNLLIYLQPDAQKKALAMFHFALKSGGTLFLGPSESPSDLIDEFQTVDKRWRLYTKRRDVRLPISTQLPFGAVGPSPKRKFMPTISSTKPRVDSSMMGIYDRLLDRKMPPSFLVNEQYDLLHVFGGAERFLEVRGGRPSNNLLDSIIEPLKSALTGAVPHAARKKDVVRYTGLRVVSGDSVENLSMVVEPIHDPRTKAGGLLVELQSEAKTVNSQAPVVSIDIGDVTSARFGQLESDLRYAQENLQATVEEMETSNEELQASNEELVASNEELQSTNEELHSVNEELYTVNAEHQRRVEELAQANDDMDNLLATTRVGVIFLDDELYIRRFTPEIARLFHLVEQDIGRSITGFSHNLNYDPLVDDLRQVISTKKELERNVEDNRGNPFLLRILPYRRETRTDGVVLTLIDISSLKTAQAELERFKFMTESANDSISLIDANGRVIYGNPSMCGMLGYTNEELVKLNVMQINPVRDLNWFREIFERSAKETIKPFRASWQTKSGDMVPVEVSMSDFLFKDTRYVCATTRDITDQVAAEEELHIQHQAMESAQNGIVISDASVGDHPIVYINPGFIELTGYSTDEILGRNCRFLQGERTDSEAVKRIRESLAAGQPCQETLLNYRKDGTTFWNELQVTPVRDADGKLVSFIGVQNDITERVEAEHIARRNATRTQTILDTTADGIIGLDLDGKCSFCNRSALRLLGYQKNEDLVGKNMHDLIHHSRADGSPCSYTDCQINRALRDRVSDHVLDDVFWRQDGSRFPVEYWVNPMIRDGKSRGSVVSFQDITRRLEIKARQTRMLQELEEANLGAHRASETKSEFLANMSHEIRTPMSAIMGYTDILSRYLDDADNLNCVNIIRENGKFLLDIIGDILDISKIEAGKIQLVRSRVRIDEMVEELRAMLQVRAHEKQLDFSIVVDGRIPQTISSDAQRLKQILLNLIGNAIKFTEQGSVKVSISYHDNHGDEALEFNVTDTGIGLTGEQIKKLFQPFMQVDASAGRKFGGTGLGLVISQRLAEMLDGTITVDSKLKSGSTFTLKLKVKADESAAMIGNEAFNNVRLNAQQPIIPLPKISGCIMVVDDRREVRFIAQHILEEAGATVITAEDGEQCIEAVCNEDETGNSIDLIVMDMQMPVLDGYEATKRLRAMDYENPIIALTAHAMEGDREKCLAVGCSEYVTKPLEKFMFLNAISRLLKAAGDGSIDCGNDDSTCDESEMVSSAISNSSSNGGKQILVIDDNDQAANSLAVLLSFEDHDVKVSTSAAGGIKSALRLKPDVVLLDLGLPEMSGFEVLNLLKAEQSLSKSKFIAVTGDSDSAKILEAGFDAHVRKPVHIEDLNKTIQKLFNLN